MGAGRGSARERVKEIEGVYGGERKGEREMRTDEETWRKYERERERKGGRRIKR